MTVVSAQASIVAVLKVVLKLSSEERIREMEILCLLLDVKILSQFTVEIITAS